MHRVSIARLPVDPVGLRRVVCHPSSETALLLPLLEWSCVMAFATHCLRPVQVLVCGLSPLVATGVLTALGSSVLFDVREARLDDLLDGAAVDPRVVDVVVVDRAAGLALADAQQNEAVPASLGSARILVVSQGCSERDIRQALEAGIRGFGTLSMSVEELQDGVRAVASGMRFICAFAAQRLADCMTREPLTRRETQVLTQLSQGKCNKTIALELGMALGTVKAHMKSLMSKFSAKTRTEVVSVAIARGLIDPVSGWDRRTSTRPVYRAQPDTSLAVV